jgi:ribulose-phosphate 3-epimerase
MGLVVPAVLPSSRTDLEEKLALLAVIPSLTRVQIDVVDGKFAPSISWPYSAPTEFKEMVARGDMLPYLDRFEYEIDLMCLDAEIAARGWLALGATRLTFHAESTNDLRRLIATARGTYGAGIEPLVSFGLALNVASDLALIEPYLGDIDYVQLMGIARIGTQGQPFDRRTLENVRLFRHRHPDMPLQVDGGISIDHARELVALGVTHLIIGSAIVNVRDPAAAIAAFEEIKQSTYGV